jgi:transposase
LLQNWQNLDAVFQPYSPELNRIELLWHKMKYEWLPFKTFTPDELEQAIDEIGAGFGSKYMLTFY